PATARLSAALAAVKASGGHLVGLTPEGAAVVHVPYPSFAAAAEQIRGAGATRVTERIPAQIATAGRLLVSYGKAAVPEEAGLERQGWRGAGRPEHDEGGALLVQPAGPLTAAAVAALENDPAITHVELEQVVRTRPAS